MIQDQEASLVRQDKKERRECEEKKVTQDFQDQWEWREIQGQKATRDHRGCRDQRYMYILRLLYSSQTNLLLYILRRVQKEKRACKDHKVTLDLRGRRDLKVPLVMKEAQDPRVSLDYKVHLALL